MVERRIETLGNAADIRENINPEDLANQSVRLKEEQLRREEGRLKEIEVTRGFEVISNCS
jgi:hypothetical protein